LGRFISRDPLGIWKDILLNGNGYTSFGQNPLNNFDYNGLETRTLEGDAEVSIEAGAGYYSVVGASGSVELSIDKEPCCLEGKKIEDGKQEIDVNAKFHGGLGFGASFTIPTPWGRVNAQFQYKGPGVVVTIEEDCNLNKCKGIYCCEACGEVGITAGHTGTVGAYGVEIELDFDADVTFQVCYELGPRCEGGWSGKICGTAGLKGSFTFQFWKYTYYLVHVDECEEVL
jgi:hypothetical protein